MKKIKLTKGQFTVVDDEDFEYLNQWKWHALENKHGYYAVRSQHICYQNGKQITKMILMHRFLLSANADNHVDHRDGDRLNNQKSNLRLCTYSQNQHNRKAQVNNKSGFKGVCKPSGRNKYKATIYLHNKPIRLGSFDTAIEAAKAYNEAALKYHGEFANLNQIPV